MYDVVHNSRKWQIIISEAQEKEVFTAYFDDIMNLIVTGRVRLKDTLFSKGVNIPDKAREAHTYIIGASKSGKSELIKDLVNSDFQKGNKSVILIEPHGDLAEQVAKLKGKNNDNLVYIDFTLDTEKTPSASKSVGQSRR